jgi:hypothetical protein
MFHMMHYRILPPDFQDRYRSVWIDVPRRAADRRLMSSPSLMAAALMRRTPRAAIGVLGNSLVACNAFVSALLAFLG